MNNETETLYGTITEVPVYGTEIEERWVGSDYDPGAKATTIAKRLRADIKHAVKCGKLPKAKYSVRCGKATHTPTIDITVKDYSYLYWSPERIKRDLENDLLSNVPFRSASVVEVENRLSDIASRYHRYRSHPQSDYYNTNYFLNVSHESKPSERESIVDMIRRGINLRERPLELTPMN